MHKRVAYIAMDGVKCMMCIEFHMSGLNGACSYVIIDYFTAEENAQGSRL